jgi:hypothetical protein
MPCQKRGVVQLYSLRHFERRDRECSLDSATDMVKKTPRRGAKIEERTKDPSRLPAADKLALF